MEDKDTFIDRPVKLYETEFMFSDLSEHEQEIFLSGRKSMRREIWMDVSVIICMIAISVFAYFLHENISYIYDFFKNKL